MARFLKTASKLLPGAQPAVDVPGIVRGVINDIRVNGDSAVRKHSKTFDSWSPPSFKLSRVDIDAAIGRVPEQTIKDIHEVQSNVRTFALAQRQSIRDFELEIQPGVFLGQRNVPIESVGAYALVRSLLGLVDVDSDGTT
jgi:histidinol dehydrogenase